MQSRETRDKHPFIPRAQFKHNHQPVFAALESNAEYAALLRRYGEKEARLWGLDQPQSYRFRRDDTGGQVFVTTDMVVAPVIADQAFGVVRLHLNADRLAVEEADERRQLRQRVQPSAVMCGKTQHPIVVTTAFMTVPFQIKASISDEPWRSAHWRLQIAHKSTYVDLYRCLYVQTNLKGAGRQRLITDNGCKWSPTCVIKYPGFLKD